MKAYERLLAYAAYPTASDETTGTHPSTSAQFALAKALEIANERLPEMAKVQEKRDRLIRGILETIPYTHLNGSAEARLPGNANISFAFIEGESLILWLDHYGICCSTGSACSTGSLDPSHVLLGIGLSHEISHGSLRLTLGPQNTEEDVDYILERLKKVVERLRAMSPIWHE